MKLLLYVDLLPVRLRHWVYKDHGQMIEKLHFSDVVAGSADIAEQGVILKGGQCKQRAKAARASRRRSQHVQCRARLVARRGGARFFGSGLVGGVVASDMAGSGDTRGGVGSFDGGGAGGGGGGGEVEVGGERVVATTVAALAVAPFGSHEAPTRGSDQAWAAHSEVCACGTSKNGRRRRNVRPLPTALQVSTSSGAIAGGIQPWRAAFVSATTPGMKSTSAASTARTSRCSESSVTSPS